MVRIIACLALVATWLMAAGQGTVRADENFRWRVDSFDTLVNKPETTYFETEREALAYKQMYEKVQNLKKGGPAYTNWKITKERKPAKPDAAKAKEPKDAEKKGDDLLTRLRKAKDIQALDPEAKPTRDHTLGDVIDEYKTVVTDTFRRIQEFEKTLRGGTQEMQEARFREINALVDRYNRQVSDFQAVMGSTGALGYKPMPRFQAPSRQDPAESPSATPADAGSLAGRTWNVAEIKGLDHYNNRGEHVAGRPLAITFNAGGTATGVYNSGEHDGTWSESGGIVTIRLGSHGRRGYSGYREGFRIRGRRNPDGSIQVLEWAQDVP